MHSGENKEPDKRKRELKRVEHLFQTQERANQTSPADTKIPMPRHRLQMDADKPAADIQTRLTANMSTDKSHYGSFANYYQQRTSTHPADLDGRLKLIPTECLTRKRILDIGCNSGAVSLQIAQHFQPAHVLGIDLDADLIRRADWDLAFKSSQAQPVPIRIQSQEPNLLEEVIKPGRAEEGVRDDAYFPISMPLMFGTIPIIPGDASFLIEDGLYAFPNNVEFKQLNIMLVSSDTDQQLGFGTWDTVLALSITKWIHVNHGDEGLIKFFRTCHMLLRDGGVLIVEPQLWNAYKQHFGGLNKAFKSEDMFQLRPLQEELSTEGQRSFVDVLGELGFHPEEILKPHNLTASGFEQRPLWLFRKIQ